MKRNRIAGNRRVIARAFGGCMVLLSLGLTSCTTLLPLPSGPEQGTAGFYDVDSSSGRVISETVSARRMSNPGDKIFVYRVDSDKVVIGLGKDGSSDEEFPFDEISKGVVITVDGARQLASFLTTVIAKYDDHEKTRSIYLDWRFVENEDVPQRMSGELLSKEQIQVRFQYSFNFTQDGVEELTMFFIGGGSAREIEYDDINILIANLQKS